LKWLLYLSLCKHAKKKKKKKKDLVVKPKLFTELNSRCQVDLIDLQTQSGGDYMFIMNYQDHLMKFI